MPVQRMRQPDQNPRDLSPAAAGVLLAVAATAPYTLLLRALTDHRGWYLLTLPAIALALVLAHRQARQTIWRDFALWVGPAGTWRRRIDYLCALRSPYREVHTHLETRDHAAAWFPSNPAIVEHWTPQPVSTDGTRASPRPAPTAMLHATDQPPDPFHTAPPWTWANADLAATIGLYATNDGTLVVVSLDVPHNRAGRRVIRQLTPTIHAGLHHIHAELSR